MSEKQKQAVTVQDMAQMQAVEQFDKSGFPTNRVLQAMSSFAATCVKTNQMPATINTVEQAIMVFQAGREYGIPPIEALNSFYFVNNRLSLYGATVMRRIREVAKCKVEYGECDDETATVTITRPDGTSLSSTVTMEGLKKRGAVPKAAYKHPKTMLIYKAVGEIVRHIAPEAVGSLSMEGDVIDDVEIMPSKRQGRVDSIDVDTTEDTSNTTVDIEVLPEIPTYDQVNKTFTTAQLREELEKLGVETSGLKTKADAINAYLEAYTIATINHDDESEEQGDE